MTSQPTTIRSTGTAGEQFRAFRTELRLGHEWYYATVTGLDYTAVVAWEAGDDTALTDAQVRDMTRAMAHRINTTQFPPPPLRMTTGGAA